MQGTTYHWCTGDHWSGGVKHNGMYANHPTSEHDNWRIETDAKRETKYGNKRSDTSGPTVLPGTTTSSDTPTVVSDASQKKLALSESLRTALCTQAGMSSDLADRIWTEACRDSGND